MWGFVQLKRYDKLSQMIWGLSFPNRCEIVKHSILQGSSDNQINFRVDNKEDLQVVW